MTLFHPSIRGALFPGTAGALARLGLALGALLLLTSAPAHAAGMKTEAEKKTVVNFDGDQIDGDLLRPDGDLLAVRPKLDLPSLVQPPRSFEQASRRTVLRAAKAAEELQGKR